VHRAGVRRSERGAAHAVPPASTPWKSTTRLFRRLYRGLLEMVNGFRRWLSALRPADSPWQDDRLTLALDKLNTRRSSSGWTLQADVTVCTHFLPAGNHLVAGRKAAVDLPADRRHRLRRHAHWLCPNSPTTSCHRRDPRPPRRMWWPARPLSPSRHPRRPCLRRRRSTGPLCGEATGSAGRGRHPPLGVRVRGSADRPT